MLTVDYDRLGLRSGHRLLDVGCGGGRHAYEAMKRGASVVAVDADEVEVKGVDAWMRALTSEDERTRSHGGHGATVAGDVLRLPFPDASFDRVIAAEVLEHLAADRLAMGELARVLRPGGRLAVTVPRWFPELVCWALSSEYPDSPGGHVRIYRRRELVCRLRSCGLEVVGSHHAHALHSPYWWLRCALGLDRQHRVVRAYHRLLVWDITAANPLTRVPERLLNPLVGKSLVLYLDKPW